MPVIKEEDGECLVIVELEDAQVGLLDLRQTDENEVISEVTDPVETNNLLVEFATVCSGDAAEDHHHRLTLPLSRCECAAVIAGPESRRIATRWSLAKRGRRQRHKETKQQNKRESAQKAIVSHGPV